MPLPVRLRFAPSPTGYLHLGNLRAALFNGLYKEKHQGSMMLRFDDTDRARVHEKYTQAIQEDLEWLGFTYDHLSYQSKRQDRYEEVLKALFQAGLLYPSYESPQSLEAQRKEAMAQGKPPRYNRQSFFQYQDPQKKREAQAHFWDLPWRLLLPEGRVSWKDQVKGSMDYDLSSLSDPIVYAPKGRFIYNFCSILDDYDGAITHIFRGEDHVTNTALQIFMWQVFRGLFSPEAPQALGPWLRHYAQGGPGLYPSLIHLDFGDSPLHFGHFSLVTDAQGQGLSKRLGSLTLGALREQGILPGTLLSYVESLGTSHGPRKAASLKELSQDFDPQNYGQSQPKFQMDVLEKLNRQFLQRLPFKEALPLLKASPFYREGQLEQYAYLWNLLAPNLESVEDFWSWFHSLGADFSSSHSFSASDKEFLNLAREILKGLAPQGFQEPWLARLMTTSGRKGKLLFAPLRQALVGKAKGPHLSVLLEILGKEETERRLDQAAQGGNHGKS